MSSILNFNVYADESIFCVNRDLAWLWPLKKTEEKRKEKLSTYTFCEPRKLEYM